MPRGISNKPKPSPAYTAGPAPLIISQAGARVIAHQIPRQAAVVANGNGSHTRIAEETDL